MTTINDRILLGVALMLGFCATAPLIDVASKLAAQTLPVGQITVARFAVQAALMTPFVLFYRLSWRMSPRVLGLTFLRALVSILATYSFVAAVQVMPIANALAIAFVEPFIILFLGWMLFGEQVGPRRFGASVAGFIGALLIIQPSFSTFGPVALFPLMTALCFALYILITRRLSRLQHPVAMQSHTAFAALVLSVPVLWLADGSGITQLDPVMPRGVEWLWLFGVGLAAAVSHMFMTYALRFAPSATLAPLHYSEMISAVAFGYLIFGDFPDALTWAGIGVIVGSGLYIIHRERINARPDPAPAAPPPDAGAATSPASGAR